MVPCRLNSMPEVREGDLDSISPSCICPPVGFTSFLKPLDPPNLTGAGVWKARSPGRVLSLINMDICSAFDHVSGKQNKPLPATIDTGPKKGGPHFWVVKGKPRGNQYQPVPQSQQLAKVCSKRVWTLQTFAGSTFNKACVVCFVCD